MRKHTKTLLLVLLLIASITARSSQTGPHILAGDEVKSGVGGG